MAGERLSVEIVASVRARLWDAGYRPIAIYNVDAREADGTPVLSPGKHPYGNGWQLRARHDPPEDAVITPTAIALNTGILCDMLRAIDVDIDDPAVAHAVRSKVIGTLGDTSIRYRDNSPRCLLIYRTSEPIAQKKRVLKGDKGKVEVLGHGQQFVSHGLHISGAMLQWMPEPLEQTPLDEIPAVTEDQITGLFRDIADLIGAESPNLAPAAGQVNGAASDFGLRASMLEVAQALGAIPNGQDVDWEGWNRIGMAVYAATAGSPGGKEAWAAWSAKNSMHKPEAVEERWNNYGRSPPQSIGAGTLFHLAKRSRPRQERQEAPPGIVEAETGEEEPQAEALAAGAWFELLQRSDKGVPRGNDFNALIALQHAPELAGKIAFDVRKGALMALKPGVYGPAGPWTSAKTAGITIWLQGQGIPAKVGHVDTALAHLGTEEQLDPLEDYLLGLQWDGIERLGHWLTTYAGVIDTPTTSLIGSKFLIGMMARALRPGCQMDYALTLEGGQGQGKSSLIRVLGGIYTSQSLPDFHSKDAQLIATSNWIIEIADLAAVGRSDLEQFKAFLTTTSDTFRPPFERYPVTRKRWSVFVLTVNPEGSGYLHDQTGNRRIWPVAVGDLDLVALAKDRDQLFAEAVACLRRGDRWWPEGAEQRALLAAEQEDRSSRDEIEDIIHHWLVMEVVTKIDTWRITKECLGLGTKDFTKALQIRIGNALTRLGFHRKKVRDGHRTTWLYTKEGTLDL